MSMLHMMNGPTEGSSFELNDDAIFVGRSFNNDIQIKEQTISRRHAKITRKDNQFFIEDLRSQNGTRINGHLINSGDEIEIKEGDCIAVGNIFISLGEPYSEDGMVTQYSINLTDLIGESGERSFYKDRRVTSPEKYELISELSTTLMQSLEIDEICEKTMNSLFHCLNRIDNGAVLLIDPETGGFKQVIARSRFNKKSMKMNYSRTIVERVFREGKAIMMSDTGHEDKGNLSESIEIMRIKSIMCVPLISKSGTKGVIYVHSVNVPKGFRKDDLFFLTVLSAPVAFAVENALLYWERKRVEEALQRARDGLELRIEERTIELSKANALLKQEIREKKQAEETLRETNNFLRNILDSSSSISIISTDLERNVLFWNKGAENIFGYKAEEIVGCQKVDILYTDDETKKTIKDIRSSLLKNKKDISREIREVTKDGREIWVKLNLTPRFDEKGHFVGILGIGEDITERKQLQKGLIHSQKMEALSVLAGGISHNFNNLLMGIQGRSSLMLMDKDSSHPDFEHLKGIEDYVKSASELTKQLLGFARGGKYEVKSTDLNELIKKQKSMFGRTRKEITIRGKYTKNLWTVDIDQGQIEQVLLNLYINAWQSMPGGGELHIATKNVVVDEGYVKPFKAEPGKYVKISITDTGVGMDETTQRRIFEPFFTTKEMGRGTGLGLASVYGIVKNHKGFVSVYSEKGEGSTFNIYLPASQKRIIKERKLNKEILMGTEVILLIDDEDMIIDVGEQVLERMGYTVLVARSGKEAIETYKRSMDKIDMVILDMIMPDMGGGEAYDRLKEINPDIKVLLSSGYSINGQATEILGRGCNGFIQKPFSIKDLSQKLREILD